MLSKLLRLGEGRMVKRLKGVADYVNTLSDDVEKLSDAELRAKTDEFKKRIADGKEGDALDDLLPEAFAVAREASWRVSSTACTDRPDRSPSSLFSTAATSASTSATIAAVR